MSLLDMRRRQTPVMVESDQSRRTEAGEEAENGMNLDDPLTKMTIERNKLRAALDKILAIVSPENDPDDVDLTLDGIVENVRRLAEYAEDQTSRVAEWIATAQLLRDLHNIKDDGTVLRPIGVAPHNVWNACRSFDEMVKAESEAF